MENFIQPIQIILHFFIGVCLYKAYSAYSKTKEELRHENLENLLHSLRKIRNHDFQGCEEEVLTWLHVFVCMFYAAVCLKAKEYKLIDIKTHVKCVMFLNEIHITFVFVSDNELRELKLTFQPDLKWFRQQKESGFEKSWPDSMDGFLRDGKNIQNFLENIK